MPKVISPKKSKSKIDPQAESYEHKKAESLLRPEIGQQAEFRKKKPPKTYNYDSSLSPALDWDGQNPARERGEAEIALAEAELAALSVKLAEELESKGCAAHLSRAQGAVRKLKALSKPFLNWAGKAERLSFDVPTLPLFVHERLSTKAILETLKGHARDRQMQMLFADPELSITDRILAL